MSMSKSWLIAPRLVGDRAAGGVAVAGAGAERWEAARANEADAPEAPGRRRGIVRLWGGWVVVQQIGRGLIDACRA